MRGQTGVTVFEGARLITGDGSPVENSAFIVENDRFTSVAAQDVQVPAGAARVELTGKTVMPTKVDLHGHIGYQNVCRRHDVEGVLHARESHRPSANGSRTTGSARSSASATSSSRSDLRGGRTNWGDVPLRVREEIIPGAALFRTAGPGIAWPGAGPRATRPEPTCRIRSSTVEEARQAVQDYVAHEAGRSSRSGWTTGAARKRR